jgi:integrase
MSYGDGRVKRYKLADGRTRYLPMVPDGRGGERACGEPCDTPEAAELARAAGLKAVNRIAAGETLGEYGERWLARVAGEQRNSRSWLSSWKNHVATTELGKTFVSELDRAAVRDWSRELAGKKSKRGTLLSWQSRKHALGLVRRCCAEAVEDGLLAANPASELKMKKQGKVAWTYLELDELAAVLALPELTDDQREAIEWSAYLGLRQGELCALQWRDLELDARVIRVRRSWDRPATKNGDPRDVSIIPEALAVIERRRARLLRSAKPSSLVFPNELGEMWSKGYDFGWGDRRNHGGKSIPERAGITDRNVTWHALRHTHASHLVSGSFSVGPWELELVRDQLGHSSVEETERYAHLTPARKARAARQAGINPESKERELRSALERIEAQLAEMKGESVRRAVGDSNARLSAPEAEESACILAQLDAAFQVDSGFAADTLVEGVRARRECPPAAARELALAVLAQDPRARAALRVLAEPSTAAALELAAHVRQDATRARRGSR